MPPLPSGAGTRSKTLPCSTNWLVAPALNTWRISSAQAGRPGFAAPSPSSVRRRTSVAAPPAAVGAVALAAPRARSVSSGVSLGTRGSCGTLVESRSAEVMSDSRSACWSIQREVSLSVDETASSRAESASGERLTALSSRTSRTCCSMRSSSASTTARLFRSRCRGSRAASPGSRASPAQRARERTLGIRGAREPPLQALEPRSSWRRSTCASVSVIASREASRRRNSHSIWFRLPARKSVTPALAARRRGQAAAPRGTPRRARGSAPATPAAAGRRPPSVLLFGVA